MKAARYYGQLDIRVEDISEPTAGPGEALVAVEWCGICGSDLHEYTKGPIAIPTPDRPHPLTKSTLPITLGHEFCGRIISAPPDTDLRPGQPVVVNPLSFCGACRHCLGPTTDGQACHTLAFLGLSGGGGGGLSSVVAVHHSHLYRLPDEASLELAALIEPLAVAYRAVRECGVTEWDAKRVLVLGGGAIGLAVAHVLRSNGVKKIYLSVRAAARKALAGRLVDEVLDPNEVDVAKRCEELTGGAGVDVVFDCAGATSAMAAAMDALRWQGIYMNVAVWTEPLTIPFLPFFAKEVALKSSFCYGDRDFEEAVAAFGAGKFRDLEDIVTSRIELEDVVEKGFEELINHKDRQVKVLVRPPQRDV